MIGLGWCRRHGKSVTLEDEQEQVRLILTDLEMKKNMDLSYKDLLRRDEWEQRHWSGESEAVLEGR